MRYRYYSICKQHIGKHVRIRTVDGRVYTGRISRVSEEYVHLSGMGSAIGDVKQTVKGETALDSGKTSKGSEVLFFFPGIIPLAAIIGLTLVGTAPYWGGGFGYWGIW